MNFVLSNYRPNLDFNRIFPEYNTFDAQNKSRNSLPTFKVQSISSKSFVTLFKIDVHTSLGTLGGFRTFGTCLSFIWRIYVTQAFCFTVEQWCDIGRYSDIGNLGVTSMLATHLIWGRQKGKI
jgi:hypothetical protein